MSASEVRSEIVMELAEEFLERYRKGERPGLKEYADRHPELAGEIREVFPAMAMMENIAIQDDSLIGEETEAQASKTPVARVLEQLGDFRIIREIGHGGMGVVYAAEQVSLGRQVALKVLSSQLISDSKQRRRFEREAKAAAKLHHTNIVPVFGVGEHEGSAYYVMQYIQGLGLDQVIEELQRMRSGGKGSADAPAVPRSAATRGDLSAADMAHSLLAGRFNPGNDGKTPTGTEIAATLAMTPSGGHAFSANDRTEGAPPLARDKKQLSASPRPVLRAPRWSFPGQARTERRAGLVRQPTGRVWRESACKWLTPSNTPTGRVFCTATSNRQTCCWTVAAPSGSPTLAWPRPMTSRTSRIPEISWAPSATCRRKPSRASSTPEAMSTPWV